MNKRTLLAVGLTTGAITLLAAPEARAELVIKQPDRHPVYRAELEPHLDFLLWHRNFSHGHYHDFGDIEVGGGFRASIEVADPAFIPKLNNTVAVTFGVDLTNCYHDYWCDNHSFRFWSPVALQWNFFLTDKWSVFGEAGAVIHSYGFFADTFGDFLFAAGGRFHFTDNIALTMRIGYPFASVGVSFFVGS